MEQEGWVVVLNNGLRLKVHTEARVFALLAAVDPRTLNPKLEIPNPKLKL